VSGSGVPGAPVILLSSLNTDAANVNGRVLSQCNLEELKKEMNMNFGDWQLFRGMVMEQRHGESQALQEESRAASEQGSSVVNVETARHQGAPHEAATHRTPSMSSLNSQESSNDICKLTDKQQAEYRDAYREYITQMTQLDVAGSGGEKPVQPHPGQFLQSREVRDPEEKAKDGTEQEGRKPSFPTKRGAKAMDADEKLYSSASKAGGSKVKGAGPRYHNVPSDEESGTEESDNTPLLQEEGKEGGAQATSDIALDKKDSSDSGLRSGESSSDHSLVEAEEVNKPNLIELELEGLVKERGLLPSSLSGLHDSTIARMSICSEAPSEGSLMASSPDETWFPASLSMSNLNRASSTTTLNNNSSNNAATTNTSQDNQDTESSTPRSSTDSTTGPVHNQNLRGIILKRALSTGEALEGHTGAPDAIILEDERESV
ncbi:unnamed protein product, partial [Coregonus sp. 'balchen']